MIKYSFVKLFSTLSKDEIKKFDKFINSPFFNKSRKIIPVYTNIKKNVFNSTIDKLTKEELWKISEIKGKYNESTIKDILLDLSNLLKKFLSVENHLNDTKSFGKNLLKEYIKRGLSKEFEKEFKILENSFNNTENLQMDNFYDSYDINTLKTNFMLRYSSLLSKNKARIAIDIWKNSNISLLMFYLIDLIVVSGNIKGLSEDRALEYKDNILFEVKKSLDIKKIFNLIKHDNSKSFLTEIYVLLNDAFEDMKDLQKYFAFKEAVFKNSYRLSGFEIVYFVISMINYCTDGIRAGIHGINFQEEMFDVFENTLENKYYIKQNSRKFDFNFFYIMIINSLKLKKYERTKALIERHYKELPEKYRQTFYMLAYSNLFYETGDYDKALNSLNEVALINDFIKSEVRKLTLKIYYERGHYENILYALENYRKFLKKSSINTGSKDRLLDFIKYLRELTHIKLKGYCNTDKDELIHKIKKCQRNTNTEWLLEKAEEL